MTKTDVAPWCYKWMGWDGLDWISQGGVMYRAPYGANKFFSIMNTESLTYNC